ncbi:MAG: hypothetical protein WBG48_07705, partial [Pricia sp.]
VLHKAIYVDGMHPEDLEWYGRYAENFGLDPVGFKNKMGEAKFKEAAHKDFKLAKRYGISGFPSLVAIKDEQAYHISQGYKAYESLMDKLRRL